MKCSSKQKRSIPRVQIQRPPAMIERKFPHTRFIEIPQMKGRTVEKVELFTTTEYHSIIIDFQDKTVVMLPKRANMYIT